MLIALSHNGFAASSCDRSTVDCGPGLGYQCLSDAGIIVNAVADIAKAR